MARPKDRQQNRTPLDSYESRLLSLQYDAAQDGYELSVESESDFKDFILSTAELQQGDLVLMENGNLRLVWEDDEDTQLGLQFLGSNRIQFVIFKRRSGEEHITQVAGRDSLTGLNKLIDAFDLQTLLYK